MPAATRSRTTRSRSRLREALSGFAALLLAAGMLAGAGAPAWADLGDNGQITLDKNVQGQAAITTQPGGTFTYNLIVGCDDNPCIDATLTDPLPPQFAGFTINSLQTNPPSAAIDASLTGCSVGGPLTPPCVLDAAFLTPLGSLAGDPKVGIPAGTTYRVSITFTVPADLTPAWPSNGVAVDNVATADAVTSVVRNVTDTARVTVQVPTVVDVAPSKSWSPSSQLYNPGQRATFQIGARNLSNMPATTLVLQDPVVAPEGATGNLDGANPFTYVDFVGLCTPSTLPAGADRVQVDLYVRASPTAPWNWITGTPSATATLPPLTSEEVGGIRFTYSSTATGAQIEAGGAASAQCVEVAQRTTNRSTGAPLVASGATVNNTVRATVTVPGEAPVGKNASAALAIGPLDVLVEPGKTITPAEVPAGGTLTVNLSARNGSNGPLTSLVVEEPGSGSFLSKELTFAGFTGWTWPSGATAGTVVWSFASAPDVVGAISSASAPIAPTPAAGDWITGFTLRYTGEIAQGTTAGAVFTVQTDPLMIADAAPRYEDVANVVGVTGTNPAGSDTKTARDTARIFLPQIGLALEKTVRPTLVTPGGTVLTELEATTSSESSRVVPTRIVVEDAWDGTADTAFWNAFRAREISFVDIPSGATMTVQYRTGAAPGTWATLVADVPSASAPYSADLVALLGAAGADAVTGLRFTYDKADGFAQGTIVKPNLVFAASGTLRTGGATTVTPGTPVAYDNTAIANGAGVSGGLPITADEVESDGTARIVDYGTGPGTLLAGKRWVGGDWSTDLNTLNSQSGSTARTKLDWGVTVPGYGSVVVSDPVPGQEATPAATAFQAFDLTGIRRVTFAQDPLLRWDTVSRVEIFVGGSWTEIPAPAGGWMDGNGFVGYNPGGTALDTLRAATGLRITVEPNDAARTASTTPGRPAPGSGVASDATARPMWLEWQLRNALRVPSGADAWVTAGTGFNTADDGVVRNTFRVDAGGFTRDASDEVTLIDTPPGVGTAKDVTPGTLVVPNPGDVPASGYPTVRYTVDAWNTAEARASYLRVTDPVPCATPTDCVTAANDRDPDVFTGLSYNATSNPFEAFTVTNVDFTVASGVPVDQTATRVALWHYDVATGTTSVTTTTMAALAAADAASLADVVGISIVYQSTDPEATGGLIPRGSSTSNTVRMTIDAQLRENPRSNPLAFVAGGSRVDNEMLAQSYDPVLGASARPRALAAADVLLSDARLDVTASKSVSPATILETNPDVPVTVTLGASDGASTASAERVTISDTTAGFWSAFAFDALGAVTRPAGADRARVDVQLDGGSTWFAGTPVASPADPALPSSLTAADLERITGIRYVFDNDPLRPFSATSPSADWTANAVFTAKLRSGAAFPSSVVNRVDALAEHSDLPAADADADATIAMSTGTARIDVRKEVVAGGTKEVQPGESYPWTLQVTNTGTSFITVNEIVDDLGPSLRYDGTAPAYDNTAAPTMPDTGVTVTQSDPSNLTFTFPAGSVLAPGDRFIVTVNLTLLAGLTPSQQAVNAFWVDTDQTFAAGDCTNVSGNGQGILGGLAANQCGTTNFVSPQAGPLLYAEKEVRGEIDGTLVDGALNITDPSLPCTATDGGFFRSVCVPATTIGATDEWRIGAANTGTIPYTSLTFVDPLPTPGDRLLATGSARGSDWRPVLDLSYGVRETTVAGFAADGVPTGTTQAIEVTTAPAPCVGSGGQSNWPGDVDCTGDGWQLLTDYRGDAADITGIRVTLDFTSTAAGVLAPGASVHFQYRTINTPWTAGDEPTADAVKPRLESGTPRAWNQVGVSAVLDGGGALRRAPERVGVQLLSGSAAVEKTVSGLASLAPARVTVDVSCTVPGGPGGSAPVDLGSFATLPVPTGGRARLDGIPLGARCSIVESGELGEFGEARRDPSGAQQLDILVPGTAADAVPVAQTVSIDNHYAPLLPRTDGLASTGVDAGTLGTWGAFALAALAAGAMLLLLVRRRPRHRRG
ncbi:MAG: hypothetical protein DI534_04075 [Leifsonia xyli]|nr:MAG: hypothetical protein DI534_04075 [Leifsonia xyli]